jgi:uncharacterized repeat protein (TIGR03803 family)
MMAIYMERPQEGTGGDGTVFRFTMNGVLTTLYSFNGADTALFPSAALVQGRDGNFYGAAMLGGALAPGESSGLHSLVHPNCSQEAAMR